MKIAGNQTDIKRGLDYIGVSAVAVVHDGSGRVLLMKRGSKARDEQGSWDICGGAIEFGESIDDAVRREINEELCVEPREIKYLTVYDAHRTHNGNKTHWIAISHAVLIHPGKEKIGEPDKIEELKWFNVDDLPTPLHSQIRKSLKPAIDLGLLY